MKAVVNRQSSYTPPVVEAQSFWVEEGFADSVTNTFEVSDPASGSSDKVDLLLWSQVPHNAQTPPTNANEQFELGWSTNDVIWQ